MRYFVFFFDATYGEGHFRGHQGVDSYYGFPNRDQLVDAIIEEFGYDTVAITGWEEMTAEDYENFLG